MCEFLSAIAFQNGDIYCRPELTDSHEDLLGLLKLDDTQDPALQKWVRVEMSPREGDWTEMKTWRFHVDEASLPVWASENWQEDVKAKMWSRILKCLVKGEQLVRFGEAVILLPGSKVHRLEQCRIYSADQATIGTLRNCEVRYANKCHIQYARRCDFETLSECKVSRITECRVELLNHETVVEEADYGCCIHRVEEGSRVKYLTQHSTIRYMNGASGVFVDNSSLIKHRSLWFPGCPEVCYNTLSQIGELWFRAADGIGVVPVPDSEVKAALEAFDAHKAR